MLNNLAAEHHAECPTTGATAFPAAPISSRLTYAIGRRSDLLVTRIDALRTAVSRIRALMPFHIDAWVVLPEHMHTVWPLPEGDANFSHRWQAIKMAFSKAIDPGETRSASRQTRGARGIWQRRFWEHTIRDDDDYAAHLDYVHFNPVKHGLAASAAAWPYSSFHRAVAQGQYPVSWTVEDLADQFKGERPCVRPTV